MSQKPTRQQLEKSNRYYSLSHTYIPVGRDPGQKAFICSNTNADPRLRRIYGVDN